MQVPVPFIRYDIVYEQTEGDEEDGAEHEDCDASSVVHAGHVQGPKPASDTSCNTQSKHDKRLGQRNASYTSQRIMYIVPMEVSKCHLTSYGVLR
jgi:hypothetical protein